MQDLENQIKSWRMKFPFSVGENRRLYDEETIQMAEEYKIKQAVDYYLAEDQLSSGFILSPEVRNSVKYTFFGSPVVFIFETDY